MCVTFILVFVAHIIGTKELGLSHLHCWIIWNC